MPDSLRLAGGSYMRRADIESILKYLYDLRCVEVGKSALLKLLAERDVWTQELGQVGEEFLPVYIDCNRMFGMSDQGFYELVLRCLQESSTELATLPDLKEAYDTLVAPASDFQIPLNFNRGLNVALQSTNRKIILLLDEFDEPFSSIDSRVFLNLRAMKDRHLSQLAYVTASGRPLIGQREEDHCSEFCELFSHRAWYLAPLTRPDSERLIKRYMDAFEAKFTAADLDFIMEWAGGHPAMLEGVCRALDNAITRYGQLLSDPVERWELHRDVARRLRKSDELALECAKIWDGCSRAAQDELLALSSTDHEPDAAVLEDLLRNHVLLRIEGRHQPFARLLTEYIQRKVMQERSATSKLWVDIDSGEVYVSGLAVETLTNLEYRLMLLLFQNADKIVDKYQIVSNVWGESYIDEVDDARIEKLVSRLRQKIEEDSGNPRFLSTVRGRGYRLALE